jgi:hypothetical protein
VFDTNIVSKIPSQKDSSVGFMFDFRLVSFAILFLTACGGGSGDNSAGAVVQSPASPTTTTYSTVKSNTVDATFNANGSVSGMSAVTVSNTSISVVTNSSNVVTSLTLTNNSGTTTFSTANGDTIDALTYYGLTIYNAYNASTSKQSLILADTTNDFGIGTWYEKSGNTGYVTTFHAGTNPTTVDPASVVNSATYNGTSAGMLAENGYNAIYTFADIVATANFNTKSISLSASNTKGYTISGGDLGFYASQNFSTTLSDGNSDNNYEGSTTDSEGKTGNVSATLYGSNAEAIAGVGTLANGSNSRVHTFAFGATR